jgi:dihydroorotase
MTDHTVSVDSAKRLVLKNFRIVDADTDAPGAVLVENGLITRVVFGAEAAGAGADSAALVIDGKGFPGKEPPVLMPALVDLHAHFRDPGPREKDPSLPVPAEVLESASLAAVAGGFGTVVCMANTRPVIDCLDRAAALKARSDALGLIDLYPVLSLSRGMEGRELSGVRDLPDPRYRPPLLSEDGRDLYDEALFRAALAEARRLGIPLSCHCDAGGAEAEAAKKAGKGREIWSRIEENAATRRALELGKAAGAPVHIAHVSTREAVELIRREKAALASRPAAGAGPRFSLTSEVSPHHLALTAEDGRHLGEESWGRVNPPLREAADRGALIDALEEGLIDAIATDHAPHGDREKEAGAPGFTGLETAFAVCHTELVEGGRLSLSALSALMSRNPARILGLEDRGRIAAGLRADLVIASPRRPWQVKPGTFKSRGNNSPFLGREHRGAILMTIHRGRIVFEGGQAF